MSTVLTNPYSNQVAISATTWTKFAECASPLTNLSINYRLLSRDLTSDVKIRVAQVPVTFIEASAQPTDDQWIQPFDLILGPNGVKTGIAEDTGFILPVGFKLIAKADKVQVTAKAHGYTKQVIGA